MTRSNAPSNNGDRRAMSASAQTTKATVLTGASQANATTIQDLQVSIQANATAIEAMQANLRNLRRREKNRERLGWTPILVERPGDNPMGTVPPNHPQSERDVLELQENDIIELERAFNLPPGYFHGSVISERQCAVLEYLYEG